jgi:hypothetical protein
MKSFFAKKLIGFKNEKKVKLKRGKKIGQGVEGKVYSGQVFVKRKDKTKAKKVVIKKFRFLFGDAGNFGRADKQFRTMKDLSTLNKQEKLGLRIIPTIRLKKNLFTYELIMTKLDIVKTNSLSPKEYEKYQRDIKRQKFIAQKNGFIVGRDAFFPIKENGKIVAIIGDFGNISKI